MSHKPDLKGLAHMVLEGDGDFDEVRILGGLTCKGSLNANNINVKGSIKAKGSIWSNALEVKGGIKVGADIITDGDISIAGGVEAKGKFEGKNIEVFGGIKTKEGLKAKELKIRGGAFIGGEVKVEGAIEAVGGIEAGLDISAENLIAIGGFSSKRNVRIIEKIEARGKVEVEEDIECDEFNLKLSGPSIIKGKLQANKIKIDLDDKVRSESYLRVKEIVCATKCDIDYVFAEKIVCPKINAGENCRIGESIDKTYDPSY